MGRRAWCRGRSSEGFCCSPRGRGRSASAPRWSSTRRRPPPDWRSSKPPSDSGCREPHRRSDSCNASARCGRRIQRSDEVKYMIMTFGSAEAGMETMGREWMVEMIKFMQNLDDDLRKSGELVDEHGLADGTRAKTVRFEGGMPVATDGPLAEAKESLVGYWIVDVDNEARAIEIASRIVALVKSPSEGRQVMDAPHEPCAAA